MYYSLSNYYSEMKVASKYLQSVCKVHGGEEVMLHEFKTFTPSKQPNAAMLLTCIQKVPSSNLGQDTDYPEISHCFHQSFQGNTRIVPSIRLDILQSFQFTVHHHPFNTIQPKFLPELLNKTHINKQKYNSELHRVVSLIVCLLHLRGKSPQYLKDRLA
jgi:hypothetical protein